MTLLFRYGFTLVHQTNKPLGLQDSLLQAVWLTCRESMTEVGRYLRVLGMPSLTLQEEGLTKGTSCPSHCPMSGAY